MYPTSLCRRVACLVAVLCLATFAPALAGPISPLYFTMLSGPGFVGELQGSAVLNLWSQSVGGENAIALPGSVRTMSSGGGAEYTFAGVPTGVTYIGPGFGNWRDGTTDGAYNYSVDGSMGSSGVYRFSNTWGNPTLLFTTGALFAGITYDPSNNSLWLSSLTGGIENRSMSGALQFSFNPTSGVALFLAMDYQDGTLWMANGASGNPLLQYSRSGVYLGFDSYPSLPMYPMSGEFPMIQQGIPEPAAGLLLASGLAALRVLRRRRQS